MSTSAVVRGRSGTLVCVVTGVTAVFLNVHSVNGQVRNALNGFSQENVRCHTALPSS